MVPLVVVYIEDEISVTAEVVANAFFESQILETLEELGV